MGLFDTNPWVNPDTGNLGVDGNAATATPQLPSPEQFAADYKRHQFWSGFSKGLLPGIINAIAGPDPTAMAGSYNQLLGGAQGAEQGRLTTGYYDQANGQGQQPQQAPPQAMPSAAPGPQGLVGAMGGVPQAAMYPPDAAPAQPGLVSAMGGGSAPPPALARVAPGAAFGPDQATAMLQRAMRVPGLAASAGPAMNAMTKILELGRMYNGSQVVPLPGALETTTLDALAKAHISPGGVNPMDPRSVTGAVAGQAGATKGAEANAQNVSDLRYKPAIAAGEQEGRNRSDAKWKPTIEGGIAGAKVAPETMLKLMQPQADRTTGEITIPWNDPQVRQSYYDGLGMKNPEGQYVAPPEAAPEAPPVAAPVPYGSKPLAEEVPKITLPTGLLPKGAGTIIQGRDPIAMKAGEAAVEQANEKYKETSSAATSANAIHAQIGTMRAQVAKGNFDPSATTPSRYLIAGFLNATMGPEIAKQVTGLDPAAGDVINKEATRMGLTYARQTEGAREAVAGINIALKGNPQIGNTKKGFLDILDLIDASAKHDMGGQATADAMFKKNGHYVGAKEFYDANHPPAEFTSKVVPYPAPRAADGSVDVSQLQPNVTYMGANGPGIWTGSGFKPVK